MHWLSLFDHHVVGNINNAIDTTNTAATESFTNAVRRPGGGPEAGYDTTDPAWAVFGRFEFDWYAVVMNRTYIS